MNKKNRFDWTLSKVILTFFLFLSLILLLEAKLLGAYIKTPVEKQGYCKLNYGERWKLSKDETSCYVYEEGEKKIITFSKGEFNKYCPKPKLVSLTFYNHCFKNGGFINGGGASHIPADSEDKVRT